MRIKLLLIILFFSFTFGVVAQDFRLGVHATPTINYISTDQANVETGSKVYFGFGGIVEYRFADRYALVSGFEIIKRGGSLTVNDSTSEYGSGYLQFPVLLRMRTREFGYFTYMAEFGLSLNFRTYDGVSFEPEIPESQLLDSYVNLFNTTFRFGIGAEYSLGGTTAIMLGLNYNRSLIDNLNAEDPRLSKRSSYRYDYVALTVGFLF